MEDLKNKDLEEKIKVLANEYENMDYSDFTGCIIALETEYGIHYQEIYNRIAEIIIKNRIKNFKDNSNNTNEFIEFLKSQEKEFDCEIDYLNLSINFLYK